MLFKILYIVSSCTTINTITAVITHHNLLLIIVTPANTKST